MPALGSAALAARLLSQDVHVGAVPLAALPAPAGRWDRRVRARDHRASFTSATVALTPSVLELNRLRRELNLSMSAAPRDLTPHPLAHGACRTHAGRVASFTNTAFGLDVPQPVPADMHMTGPILPTRDSREYALPKDVQEWLDARAPTHSRKQRAAGDMQCVLQVVAPRHVRPLSELGA